MQAKRTSDTQEEADVQEVKHRNNERLTKQAQSHSVAQKTGICKDQPWNQAPLLNVYTVCIFIKTAAQRLFQRDQKAYSKI